MTIEECRAKNCVHASVNRNRRNCGVTDCSDYEGYYYDRHAEEEDWEFDDCVDEEEVGYSCDEDDECEDDEDIYMEKLFRVLYENKVSFEQLIRCYNFWVGLTQDEVDKYIKAYDNGELKGKGGHY